jgi:hypothetical protein
MSKKKIIILIIVLVAIVAGVYGYCQYNRTNKDLGSVKEDYAVKATALISEYMSNESQADDKYRNKILSVNGMVKRIDTSDNYYTVVVGDTTDMSSVRCSIDSTHTTELFNLKRGMNVTIKGAMTGFKKDDTGLLGSDVELNRCVVQQ